MMLPSLELNIDLEGLDFKLYNSVIDINQCLSVFIVAVTVIFIIINSPFLFIASPSLNGCSHHHHHHHR